VIRSVEINGLRGIREGKLEDFTPVVVLVGPNGSGKSTVLDALYIGSSPNPAEAVGLTVERREEFSRGARWLLWKGGAEGAARVEITTDAPARRVCELLMARSNEGPHPRINGKLLDTPGDNREDFSVTFNHSFPRNSGAPSFQLSPATIRPLNGVSDVRFVDHRAKALQDPLLQLYTQAFESGRIGQTKALIKSLMPAVEDIQILVEGTTPLLYLIYADRAVPAALAGDGIFLLLRLSLELTTRGAGTVLLEEPEVHLHPGGIYQCARVLVAAARRGIQVVLTTHSLDLIDDLLSELNDTELELLTLYSMDLVDGTLKFFRKAGPDVAFARTQIHDDLR
jgi:energy-coupling factor transporter ATP-binding protein EcfA2